MLLSEGPLYESYNHLVLNPTSEFHDRFGKSRTASRKFDTGCGNDERHSYFHLKLAAVLFLNERALFTRARQALVDNFLNKPSQLKMKNMSC